MADATSNPVTSAPQIRSSGDYFVYHVLSNTALIISLAILTVGLVALLLQFRVMRGRAVSPGEILRITAVTLIITFSLSLAAFLESSELRDAAPIFGLFSTIVGYLLGSAQRNASDQPTKVSSKNEQQDQ